MERPILFSSPMVQAILAGQKTQTRRVIKKQPHGAGAWIMQGVNWLFPNVNPYINLKCPYGKPGDVLWVRETFSPIEFEDGTHYRYKATFVENSELHPKWKPSIFMPKTACRIKLLIKDIGVERLNDISELDALEEGISSFTKDNVGFKFGLEGWHWSYQTGFPFMCSDAKLAYSNLWESINGKDSWSKNPWVWKITFDKL